MLDPSYDFGFQISFVKNLFNSTATGRKGFGKIVTCAQLYCKKLDVNCGEDFYYNEDETLLLSNILSFWISSMHYVKAKWIFVAFEECT